MSTGYKIKEPEGIYFHRSRAFATRAAKFIDRKINYIHQNPVRSGIVQHPEGYLYSSARNYADEENILDVSVFSFLWKTVK